MGCSMSQPEHDDDGPPQVMRPALKRQSSQDRMNRAPFDRSSILRSGGDGGQLVVDLRVCDAIAGGLVGGKAAHLLDMFVLAKSDAKSPVTVPAAVLWNLLRYCVYICVFRHV